MLKFLLKILAFNLFVVSKYHSQSNPFDDRPFFQEYYSGLGRFRELVANDVSEKKVKIGGEGVIVLIDESKFGKIKYNLGHRVEGVWLVGGVEITKERKLFLVEVSERKAVTMLNVIKKYVQASCIVHTDLFKSYNNLERDLKVQQITGNHSECYVNPDTGVHTNNIEGTWNGIKMSINVRNRISGTIISHLLEYEWRRANSKHIWRAFLNRIKDYVIS